MLKRRVTRVVRVGGVKIGGNNPIAIQAMAKTDTRDTKKTIIQIRKLEKAGCEIVRVAVKDKEAAWAIKKIKREIHIPLVADIHFDYRLALESIKGGVDKIRINPGNISDPKQLREIVCAAEKRKIPIRLGLNSGSLVTKDKGRETKENLFIKTALKYIGLFEKEGLYDIIVSLKSSDVEETVRAYQRLATFCDYPFHIGITAAGPHDIGIVKSSIGIGALLLEGIGDTIRVSLTGDPVDEVIVAKKILQALNLRYFEPSIISCPTCGRCQVDLARFAKKLERELSAFSFQLSAKKPFTIALMGCEVNGPGEARHADVGIAAGKGCGIIFKKGKVIKKVKEKNFIKEIVKEIKLTAES